MLRIEPIGRVKGMGVVYTALLVWMGGVGEDAKGGIVRRDDLSCPYEACDGDRRCAYNPVVGVLESMRTLDRGGEVMGGCFGSGR